MSYFDINNLDNYQLDVSGSVPIDIGTTLFVYDQSTDSFADPNIPSAIYTFIENVDNDYTFAYVDGINTYELVIEILGDSPGTIISATIFEFVSGEFQNEHNLYGNYLTDGDVFINSFPIPPPDVPCFTNTCNILTPLGYKNITDFKEGDEILTSDNRIVQVQKILISSSTIDKSIPRLIKAHQFGKNQPLIDTYISDYHAFQVDGKWKLPKKINLPQEWSNNKITYYHLQLPDYYNDNLIVNGLIMEGWDGKLPYEFREYKWIKIGNKFTRKLLI